MYYLGSLALEGPDPVLGASKNKKSLNDEDRVTGWWRVARRKWQSHGGLTMTK